MTKKDLVAQLNEMRGGTFIYAGQTHTVAEIQTDDENGKFTIRTNLSNYTRKYESGEEFIKYWKPLVQPGAERPAEIQVYDSKETALADEMINILKDNIQKVKDDPNYIKQAQTINNNVNSIINVVRTKLDFAKHMKSQK